jgi:hypothetical protein
MLPIMGVYTEMLPHHSIGGILSLKLLCVMVGCRSPQKDSAVHHGCRPFETRGETRVPARRRPSSPGTHARSSGAGSRRERPALQKPERRVRRCGLRRNWRGAGRHVMTGGGQVGDVIAVVISILSWAPAATEAAASWPVGPTRVTWTGGVNDVAGGWHEQERCRRALSPLSPGPSRGMVAGGDDVGERRCADLHTMRAEPGAMRPRRCSHTYPR